MTMRSLPRPRHWPALQLRALQPRALQPRGLQSRARRSRVLPAILLPLIVLPLAACAASGGEWPSLKTPAEKRAEAGGATVVTAAAAPTSGPAAPTGVTPASPDLAAIRSRIAEERRDFEVAASRWTAQNNATAAAVSAASGTASGSEAWAKAQIELTRLSEAAAKFDDTRTSVNRAAGDLAILAAGGTDITGALGDAGRLLRRIADAQATHAEAFERLQGGLAH